MEPIHHRHRARRTIPRPGAFWLLGWPGREPNGPAGGGCRPLECLATDLAAGEGDQQMMTISTSRSTTRGQACPRATVAIPPQRTSASTSTPGTLQPVGQRDTLPNSPSSLVRTSLSGWRLAGRKSVPIVWAESRAPWVTLSNGIPSGRTRAPSPMRWIVVHAEPRPALAEGEHQTPDCRQERSPRTRAHRRGLSSRRPPCTG